MRKYFNIALLLLMFTACVSTSNAANKQQRQWTKEMLDYKHEYIVKATEMTQAQRDKLMPIYEAMEKEIFAVYRNAREQSKKVTSGKKVTDDEYAPAAKAMADVKYKVGEIESRYFNQFAKILSKKQLFLLKQAEIKFTRDMVAKKKKK